ncbi:DUF6443 domain-containing protein [Chryseobacterium camelliae]|uniref:DUF6443 domain-containing protein n=1 Tax=Chryseobacterium camelliae TaxID=1265445 RepID=A0ABY7QNU1_9FLAO|nr:DUF6443 domain-containing protein [Chryseobacterium camelliae]WBV60642.1 DUF6443 domain-containing protein [Chryseobacterium camelliae]
MKNRLSLFSLLFGVVISAQTTSLSTGENYIYTKNCLNEDCSKKTETVQYSDGLGRIKQTINIKATPAQKDIVIPSEYDNFGRQLRSYLPIPQSGTQNGAIYTDPKSNASQSYGTDQYFYSESVVESSPTGRPLSQTKPGTDFQGHPITFGYEMNASGEVKKYTVTTSWQNGATAETMSQDGTFAAGQLMKNSVTDEDGNTTSEFKNGKGQTLMVRKGNTETYYVYNKYDHLAFVIPPLASTAALDQIALNTLCYQYKYDSKSRQVAKKLPGKDWEYFVYDKMSRMVMSQDANMGASKQWLFTKYDQFGRVVYTGIYTGSQYYGNAGRETEQNTMNAVTVQTESRNAGGFNASGLTAYYTNTVFPTSFTKILSINYYDTYPAGSVARPSQVFGKNTIGDDLSQNINTKNLPTASYVKNIEDDNWTKNYIWYDEKARAIGTHSINHLGGSTRTETELDFAGVVLQTKAYHKRLSSDTEKVITRNFEYDAQNRLKKQWHTVDGGLPELLAENSYNELSQLSNKTVGNNLQSIDYTYNIRGALTKVNDPSATGKLFGYELKYYLPAGTETGKRTGNIAEVLWRTASDQVLRKYSYQYDALNRMTSGTFTEPNASVPQNGFYNETATYDLGGNITALQRNGKNALNALALIDNLSYSYTGNRLNSVTDASADYNGYPDVSGNTIAYDDNGNMKDHLDKGILQIDYNFLNLPDYVKFNQSVASRGGARYVNTTYIYDADGNKLRKDYQYKDGTNEYLASATTDYLDGFQYEANSTLANPTPVYILKFVPTSEGYYDFEKNKYIYSYTDHLGNVRLSYTKNGSGTEIIEENNYYPFGLKHQGYNQTLGNPSYQYEYSGKELQQETGWNDFGARMYMSDIGRWGVIDPLAETTTKVTPYNYALNNPVMFIDPDGRKAMYMGPEYDLFGVENIGIINQLNQMSYNRFGSFTSFLGDGMPFNTGASSGGGGGGLTFGQLMNAAGVVMNGSIESYEQGIGVLSIWQQLKIAGWDDPANTDAKYSDLYSLLEKVPSLNELLKITKSRFMEDNNLKQPAETVKDVVYLNMGKIKNILFYAFTLGHEMNHVFDNVFFQDKFSEITHFSKDSIPFNKSFKFFKESTGLGWEMKMGNTKLQGLNGFESAQYYYGPKTGIYEQSTINQLLPFINELNIARKLEYKKQYNLIYK